jgi:hypothetical protein
MKQISFFALKEDILPVFQEFEARDPVNYVPAGISNSSNYVIFSEGTAIPNLGIASKPAAINCVSFLVNVAGEKINLRTISTIGEKSCFAIDQLHNPNTIILSPGGLWDNEILLHGRIATTSDSEVSQALMIRFKKALNKTFIKIKAFYVGPQALAFLKKGKRLTISTQSPKEFDLRIDR